MEPFEWLILGIGLAVGSLVGSRGKGLVRTAAKGYLTVEEKAKQMTANMREDFRDAVEEARYERDQEIEMREAAANGDLDGELDDEYIIVEEVEAPESARKAHGDGTRARGTAKKPAVRKAPTRPQSGVAASDASAAAPSEASVPA